MGKTAITRLSDLKEGERGTFFALLTERIRNEKRDGKPFYICKFRDLRRSVGFVAWGDGAFFQACDTEWRPNQFFKIRAEYGVHPKYGPQIDIQQIRHVLDRDAADGFDPTDLVERSRFDSDVML